MDNTYGVIWDHYHSDVVTTNTPSVAKHRKKKAMTLTSSRVRKGHHAFATHSLQGGLEAMLYCQILYTYPWHATPNISNDFIARQQEKYLVSSFPVTVSRAYQLRGSSSHQITISS